MPIFFVQLPICFAVPAGDSAPLFDELEKMLVSEKQPMTLGFSALAPRLQEIFRVNSKAPSVSQKIKNLRDKSLDLNSFFNREDLRRDYIVHLSNRLLRASSKKSLELSRTAEEIMQSKFEELAEFEMNSALQSLVLDIKPLEGKGPADSIFDLMAKNYGLVLNNQIEVGINSLNLTDRETSDRGFNFQFFNAVQKIAAFIQIQIASEASNSPLKCMQGNSGKFRMAEVFYKGPATYFSIKSIEDLEAFLPNIGLAELAQRLWNEFYTANSPRSDPRSLGALLAKVLWAHDITDFRKKNEPSLLLAMFAAVCAEGKLDDLLMASSSLPQFYLAPPNLIHKIYHHKFDEVIIKNPRPGRTDEELFKTLLKDENIKNELLKAWQLRLEARISAEKVFSSLSEMSKRERDTYIESLIFDVKILNRLSLWESLVSQFVTQDFIFSRDPQKAVHLQTCARKEGFGCSTAYFVDANGVGQAKVSIENASTLAVLMSSFHELTHHLQNEILTSSEKSRATPRATSDFYISEGTASLASFLLPKLIADAPENLNFRNDWLQVSSREELRVKSGAYAAPSVLIFSFYDFVGVVDWPRAFAKLFSTSMDSSQELESAMAGAFLKLAP